MTRVSRTRNIALHMEKHWGIEKGGGEERNFSMRDLHVPLYLHLWSVKPFHRLLSVCFFDPER